MRPRIPGVSVPDVTPVMVSKEPEQHPDQQAITTPHPPADNKPTILKVSQDADVPAGATLELTCIAEHLGRLNVRTPSFDSVFLYIATLS